MTTPPADAVRRRRPRLRTQTPIQAGSGSPLAWSSSWSSAVGVRASCSSETTKSANEIAGATLVVATDEGNAAEQALVEFIAKDVAPRHGIKVAFRGLCGQQHHQPRGQRRRGGGHGLPAQAVARPGTGGQPRLPRRPRRLRCSAGVSASGRTSTPIRRSCPTARTCRCTPTPRTRPRGCGCSSAPA